MAKKRTSTRKENAETEGIIGPAEPSTRTYSERDADEQLMDANIIYTGTRMVNGELIPGNAPLSLIDGNDTFEMPDAETQAAGFYHEAAKRIIAAFPHLYKQVKKLGE